MRRRLAVMAGLAALGGCGMPTTADRGPDDCNIPASHRWERDPPPGLADTPAIDRNRVRPVSHDLPAAVQALALRSAVPLSDADVRRFTGMSPPSTRHGLRPYLVRAVYPDTTPVLSVHRRGGSVLVSAHALGCAPFVGHPVVLLLPALPETVFVDASAAL